MKISKKAYYGLRAMTRLAGETEPLSVHTLAEEEGLPEEFLEKIFQGLRKAGIVTAVKGAAGGYSLALDPEDITAGHILTVLDGALVPFPCTDPGTSRGAGRVDSQAGCPMQGHCATQNVWQRLSLAIADNLDGITLKDLIK